MQVSGRQTISAVFSAMIGLVILVSASVAMAVTGTIKTDGAMIYAKPDFDAEVLTTLTVGQKVVVSKGTTGDPVKFHRVRAGPVVGYISDLDVAVDGGAATGKSSSAKKSSAANDSGRKKKTARSKKANASKSKKHSSAQEESRQKQIEERQRQQRAALPFVFNRYVGLVLGVAGYEEEIGGSKKKESLLVYGLKATGPDLFFQGPILDLNLLLHYGAPKGYADISSTKPSGFFILADTLLLLPMLQREKFLGTLGLGPQVSYRSYKTVASSGFVSHGGFGIGLSLQASAGLRLGDYALRLEGKYLVDKRIDTIFQLSLQNAF